MKKVATEFRDLLEDEQECTSRRSGTVRVCCNLLIGLRWTNYERKHALCESNKPLCKSKLSQTDCSPRRSRMKESREELYSFWCVSVGLTVSLSFVLSFLCGLSFALYLLSGAGGVQWNWNTGKIEKKWEGWGGGGGEDEFPVYECASGVKSLAYLPPLFYFSFCDRWGMLAAL